MITLIRIKGMTATNHDIAETLHRLRLRRKYACVVIAKPTPEQLGMIKKVQNWIALGKISEKTLSELIEKRGKPIDTKKPIAKDASEKIAKGAEFTSVNLKPFFRLHPPRGGIDSKLHFPRGVLGNHEDKISELIARML